MKRLLPLLGVAALVAALSACGGGKSKPGTTTNSAPTMHAGELTVGFGDPAPGFVVGQVRGSKVLNPKGYEVDLATDVAKALHVTPVWVYAPWTGLFAPGSKKFDVAFEEATITAQRKKTVDFTGSYLNANQGVLLSTSAPVPHSLADLKALQTCAQSDTTGLQYIQDQLKPSKTPLTYPTTTGAYTSVANGTCQAFILDVPLVLLEKKQYPTRFGPVAGQIVTNEQYGAVLPKGSKLTMKLDSILQKLTQDGTIGNLQKKWFKISFTQIPTLK